MRHDVKRKNPNVRSPVAPVAVPGLDSHLCFALYAASNHMTRLFVPFLQKLGVTYPQYLVLVVLWERGPQGVGDLASLLRVEFGTLSPMLKRIEEQGADHAPTVPQRRAARAGCPDADRRFAAEADRTDAGRVLLLFEHAAGRTQRPQGPASSLREIGWTERPERRCPANPRSRFQQRVGDWLPRDNISTARWSDMADQADGHVNR